MRSPRTNGFVESHASRRELPSAGPVELVHRNRREQMGRPRRAVRRTEEACVLDPASGNYSARLGPCGEGARCPGLSTALVRVRPLTATRITTQRSDRQAVVFVRIYSSAIPWAMARARDGHDHLDAHTALPLV